MVDKLHRCTTCKKLVDAVYLYPAVECFECKKLRDQAPTETPENVITLQDEKENLTREEHRKYLLLFMEKLNDMPDIIRCINWDVFYSQMLKFDWDLDINLGDRAPITKTLEVDPLDEKEE